jgi:hypothetical protein
LDDVNEIGSKLSSCSVNCNGSLEAKAPSLVVVSFDSVITGRVEEISGFLVIGNIDRFGEVGCKSSIFKNHLILFLVGIGFSTTGQLNLVFH